MAGYAQGKSDESGTDGPFATLVLHGPAAQAKSFQCAVDHVAGQLRPLHDPLDADRLEGRAFESFEDCESFRD
jgi:hypothetical protein